MTNDNLFWEKFGFKHQPWVPDLGDSQSQYDGWEYPTGSYHKDPPEPNLDNLFRYCWDRAIGIIIESQKCSVEQAYSLMFDKWLKYMMEEKGANRDSVPLKKAIEEIVK